MRKLIALILCILTLFSLVACTGNNNDKPLDNGTVDTPDDNQDTPTPDTPDAPDIPDTPDTPDTPDIPDTPDTPDTPDIPEPPKGNMNPLTGLYDGISDEMLSRRPVAIMLGNSSAALPQWGVCQADIIYEMIAEARMTRLMAIFQDPSKIDKVASIRSARPYFIDIAQSYGAIFMHFGGSVPAYEQIAARTELIDIDGIKGNLEGTIFFRDEGRRKEMGREHSVYTTGELIEKVLAKQKRPLEQKEHPSAFTFAEQSSAANGTPMSKVQYTFKSTHKPYFIYDQESGKYLRYQYQKPQMDGITNQQIAVTNLLVLRMELTDLNDDLQIIDIKTTGTGTGYYFCGGKYVEITWKKDTYNSPITYYTKDGSELVCCPGQTFVSVITLSADVVIE